MKMLVAFLLFQISCLLILPSEAWLQGSMSVRKCRPSLLRMSIEVASATVSVKDLQRSKAFYNQYLKLPIKQETSDSVEVELSDGLSLKLEQYVATDPKKVWKQGEVHSIVTTYAI